MLSELEAEFEHLERYESKETREELESRRIMLSAAYEAHSEDIREEAEQKIHVEEAR